jgi:DNA-directed RNA polymerase specialized sigma24 family protein
MNAIAAVKPKPEEVLTNALMNAAEQLDFSQAEIAKIVGVSAATVSRMSSGAYLLDANRAEWDSAATLVLVYRSLASILPNNIQEMRAWLHSINDDFGDVPAKLMLKPSGLHQIRSYLDAYRGRA